MASHAVEQVIHQAELVVGVSPRASPDDLGVSVGRLLVIAADLVDVADAQVGIGLARVAARGRRNAARAASRSPQLQRGPALLGEQGWPTDYPSPRGPRGWWGKISQPPIIEPAATRRTTTLNFMCVRMPSNVRSPGESVKQLGLRQSPDLVERHGPERAQRPSTASAIALSASGFTLGS